MKDEGHHMTKLLKKYKNEKSESDPSYDQEFAKEKSPGQIKKQQKIQRRKQHTSHIAVPPTSEQKNKLMKHRTSLYRQRSDFK